MVARFFSHEFTRRVPPGQEHLYKLSIAIAEKLYGGLVDPGADVPENESRMGGIVYPAIAMQANSDNLALVPDFVDRYMDLEAVEWVRIRSQAHLRYEIDNIDFADTFGLDGRIEWKGRPANWTFQPGIPLS